MIYFQNYFLQQGLKQRSFCFWYDPVFTGENYLFQKYYYLFISYCSSTVVSIFTPPRPTLPCLPPSKLPLWLCPCVLFTCSLMALPLFSPIIPFPCPSGYCSLFLFSTSLVIILLACFVLLIRFHL